jgi:hypothetical protein
VTTNLDERFDLAPLGQLFCPHSFCYLERVTLDTNDDGMREGPLLRPFIVLFDNDNLLSGVTPLEDDCDLLGATKVRSRMLSPS